MNPNHGKIKKRLLAPLVIVLLLMLATSIVSVYMLQKWHIDKDVRDRLHSVQQLLPGLIQEEAKFMKAQMEFLQDNKSLQKAWLARDREMLLQQALPIFQKSLARFGVSHFYFIGVDRKCFLRVHNPSRHSDFIKRFTMDEAARSKSMAYGIELGPLGTFTLRVVYPWRIDGELVGYIELGEEMEHLTPSLKKILNVDLTYAIDKKHLDRPKWEEGIKMLGHSGDWDKYPRHVIADTTFKELPDRIQEYLSRSAPEKFEFKISINNKVYKGGSIPLIDAGRRNVGKLIVFFEITDMMTSLYGLMQGMMVISIIIGGALFIFFYLFTGSIETDITTAFDNLNTQIKERQRIEEELKEHEDQLEKIVYERTLKLKITNEALQKEVEERKKTEGKLLNTQRELLVLYNTSQIINQSIDINDLLHNVLEAFISSNILNIERKGGIFFLEGDSMKLVSHVGASELFLSKHNNMKTGDCLCGIAAKTGEMIISKNCENDRNHTIRYSGMEPHGHIIMPMKLKDTVVGVLYLYIQADCDVDEDKLNFLRSVVNQISIAIENSKLYEETKTLSLYDPLTGLANRRFMDIVFKRNFARAKRLEQPFSVIMLDIDDFKIYNDAYGHSEGDKLLVEIAELLLKEIREVDLVARYGGEEFLVILPEVSPAKAFEVAERIRKSIEAQTEVTVSLGISFYQKGIHKKEELIEKADEALYTAKNKGKNRVEVDA